MLKLNTERLRRARENHWNALSDNWSEKFVGVDLIAAATRVELLPNEENRLPTCFTTSRSYFAPLGEDILAEEPKAWI